MAILAQQLSNLAAVAILVAVIWLFGRTARTGLDDEPGLAAAVRREHPDFVLGGLALGRDHQAALALDARGEDMLLFFLVGARRVAWRLPMRVLERPGTRYEPDSDTLIVDTGDPTRPVVRLLLPRDTPRTLRVWTERITA